MKKKLEPKFKIIKPDLKPKSPLDSTTDLKQVEKEISQKQENEEKSIENIDFENIEPSKENSLNLENINLSQEELEKRIKEDTWFMAQELKDLATKSKIFFQRIMKKCKKKVTNFLQLRFSSLKKLKTTYFQTIRLIKKSRQNELNVQNQQPVQNHPHFQNFQSFSYFQMAPNYQHPVQNYHPVPYYQLVLNYQPIQSYQLVPNYMLVPHYQNIQNYQPVRNYHPVSNLQLVKNYQYVQNYEPVRINEPVQNPPLVQDYKLHQNHQNDVETPRILQNFKVVQNSSHVEDYGFVQDSPFVQDSFKINNCELNDAGFASLNSTPETKVETLFFSGNKPQIKSEDQKFKICPFGNLEMALGDWLDKKKIPDENERFKKKLDNKSFPLKKFGEVQKILGKNESFSTSCPVELQEINQQVSQATGLKDDFIFGRITDFLKLKYQKIEF